MNEANPYESFSEEEMILRDQLAVDRTILANERTFLAYVRTSLACLVVGTSCFRFFTGLVMYTLGVVFLFFAGGLFYVGVVRYRTRNRRIRVTESFPTGR